ncbi:MAG: response regulator [Planctomycetota bacterium]|jgi:DNA-binding NtrC family response regulator
MYKVLVVDDDNDVCHFLSEIITLEKCEPVVFNNSADVFSDLRKLKDINMAILDINMPGDSGVKIAWDLRKKFPNLPIVILSGYLSQWYIPDIRDCGADCVLEKPADIEMLRQTINRFTSKGRKGGCQTCSYADKDCPAVIHASKNNA